MGEAGAGGAGGRIREEERSFASRDVLTARPSQLLQPWLLLANAAAEAMLSCGFPHVRRWPDGADGMVLRFVLGRDFP
jgi:hypothetical protein